ncbi:hypothetical protein PAESOLCIP111_06287 [Paenibacillus solanacearum]|uniref:Activator of Hsp90 ATPase homologue 1/2-like C-terminal domain-containing protein n=1 Tax=Paenibacillus solanacearum TaxID=2048548 RepID=A0A916NLP4_9BACL|nr:SRPBCC family protein [Paenibacillus solanacearum]CAG7651298.1 hypothetical protein PAESOLCIP111_06287 [Paenibacillus solanacearum]
MNNVSNMRIYKPAHEVFEAIVDPVQIGNFWFSSSSARWEQGKTVTLKYDEYGAEGDIRVIEIVEDRKIVFEWDYGAAAHVVTMTLNEANDGSTVIEVNEEGFDETDEHLIELLIGNKEGWVYMLTCLKAYLEFGVTTLRAGLVKE